MLKYILNNWIFNIFASQAYYQPNSAIQFDFSSMNVLCSQIQTLYVSQIHKYNDKIRVIKINEIEFKFIQSY